MRIIPTGVWVLSLLLGVTLTAGSQLSTRDSARFQTKLTKINQNGHATRPASLRTPVSESELNSYLRYALAPDLPAGVTDPYVSIQGDGRVSGQATVDLNRVKAERAPGNWLDPLAYLGGKAPVAAVGALHTSKGTARFDLESATISGVAVPAFLLEALVSYYSRTPENPDGIKLNETFKLPAGIQEIHVGKGEAVVVQ